MKTAAKTLLVATLSLGAIIPTARSHEVPPATQTVPSELRLVSIFAQGKGRLTADSAVVELLHTVEASELKAAIDLSLKAKEALQKSLNAAGITKSDIVFQNFSSATERGRILGKVKRHSVTSPIQVTVKTEAQFAKIAVMVDADEKLNYLGRKAHISDPASLQVKAAEDAIKNLKRKIALYESAFAVKLKLISFGEVSQKQVELGQHAIVAAEADHYLSRRASKPATSAGYAYSSSITQSFGDEKATVYVSGVYRIVEE